MDANLLLGVYLGVLLMILWRKIDERLKELERHTYATNAHPGLFATAKT